MPILSKPSDAARTSVMYVTLGSLVTVWSGIWYWYLSRNPPINELYYYLCYGSLLSGIVILIIGLALGRIGRAARDAELPPKEVTGEAVVSEQNAAARAPVIAPVNPAIGAYPGAGGAAYGAGGVVPTVQPVPAAPAATVPPTATTPPV